jgi:hypothetical protein
VTRYNSPNPITLVMLFAERKVKEESLVLLRDFDGAGEA